MQIYDLDLVWFYRQSRMARSTTSSSANPEAEAALRTGSNPHQRSPPRQTTMIGVRGLLHLGRKRAKDVLVREVPIRARPLRL